MTNKLSLKCVSFALVLLVAVLVMSSKVHAHEQLLKNIEATIKTLNYVRTINSSSTGDFLNVAVAFEPGNWKTIEEADLIVNTLNKIGKIKKKKLNLVKVPVNSVSPSVDVLFVTTGLNKSYEHIKKFSILNHILNISMDPSCTKNNVCVIAVDAQSSPVKIYLNEKAMEEAGFDVDSTFRYLAIRDMEGNSR